MSEQHGNEYRQSEYTPTPPATDEMLAEDFRLVRTRFNHMALVSIPMPCDTVYVCGEVPCSCGASKAEAAFDRILSRLAEAEQENARLLAFCRAVYPALADVPTVYDGETGRMFAARAAKEKQA